MFIRTINSYSSDFTVCVYAILTKDIITPFWISFIYCCNVYGSESNLCFYHGVVRGESETSLYFRHWPRFGQFSKCKGTRTHPIIYKYSSLKVMFKCILCWNETPNISSACKLQVYVSAEYCTINNAICFLNHSIVSCINVGSFVHYPITYFWKRLRS